HHRGFIETIFGGETAEEMPGRPASPWAGGRGGTNRWATADDIAHYVHAFADPASHRHAISYYRYGLPFHRVIPDASATHGERFVALDEQQVTEMWLHSGGLEQHPLYPDSMDFGPEDRHKRFEKPVLWMPGNYLGAAPSRDPGDTFRAPRGHPFV